MRNGLYCALIAVSLAGCSATSPVSLTPPPAGSADNAQVTVQREFRILGGGAPQTHNLFDMGTGVEFDTSLPAKTLSGPVYRLRARVTEALFDRPERKMLTVGVLEPPTSTRVLRRIDKDPFGKAMVASIDRHSGRLVFEDPRIRDDRRGTLQRVRHRQLYVADQGLLLQVLRASDEPCTDSLIDTDWPSKPFPDWSKVRRYFESVFSREGFEMNEGRGAYSYGETCGIVLSFEPEWNARHVGAFPGYSPLTWERPPGRMALVGTIGYQYVAASPLDVEAGKRYGGIYDPNDDNFVVSGLD